MDKIQIIEKLFLYIADIVVYSYLLLPLVCIRFFVLKKSEKVIPIMIGLYGLVFFVLLLYFKQIPKEYKHFYQGLYTFLEYSFFAYIFWAILRNKKLKNLIIVFSIAFLIFQLVYVFTAKTLLLDSIPIGIETILILIYIFFFFYEFSKNLNSLYIYNHYCFWIAVGILIYLGGSFFFYLSINQLNKEERTFFGNLTFVAEIIKNVLFSVALFMYARNSFENQKKKSDSVPFLDMI